MADARLQIIIDALNNAGKELDALRKDMGEVEKATDGAEKSQTNFRDTFAMTMLGINQGIQVAQQLAAAMKAAFDFTYEGAQIMQTGIAFASLTSQIDIGEDTIQEWRAAVNGTVTDLELMIGFQTLAAGVSKDLTQEFANNNAQLLAISKAASALNPQLGDTAFMYESITRGIKRASPMILDNLGIIVKVGEANERLAEQLGKTVDELTAEEKQMAILNEVLAAGDTLINQLGGSVDSVVDPWDRFTTALENSKNQAKINVNELGILPKVLDDIATSTNDVLRQQELLTRALELGVIGQDEYNHAMMILGRTGKANTEMIEDLKAALVEYQDSMDIDYQQGMADVVGEIGDQGFYAARAMRDYGTAAGEAEPDVNALKDATNDADAAMQSYNNKLLFSIASQGMHSDKALILARSMGLVDERTVYATEKIDIWRGLLDEGKISVETYNSWVARLADNMDRIEDKSAKIVIDWKETGAPSPAALQYMGQYWTPTISGNNAAGGPVQAGNPYLWQEYGYKGEVMVPSQNGFVLSRADAKRILEEAGNGKGGGNTYNFNLTANYPYSSPLSLIDQVKLLEAAYV